MGTDTTQEKAAQVAGHIVRTNHAPKVKNHQELSPIELGKMLGASGYFPDAQSAAQAAVKVMAGAELGIKPIAAMTGIYIVKGRVMLGATLLASLVDQHPDYSFEVEKLDGEGCAISFFKGEKQIGISTFSAADAKRQVTQNTDKFPRNMYFARAMSNGVKWYCPGVLGGLPIYTEGEVEDTDAPLREGTTETAKLSAVLDAVEGAGEPDPQDPAEDPFLDTGADQSEFEMEGDEE